MFQLWRNVQEAERSIGVSHLPLWLPPYVDNSVKKYLVIISPECRGGQGDKYGPLYDCTNASFLISQVKGIFKAKNTMIFLQILVPA